MKHSIALHLLSKVMLSHCFGNESLHMYYISILENWYISANMQLFYGINKNQIG